MSCKNQKQEFKETIKMIFKGKDEQGDISEIIKDYAPRYEKQCSVTCGYCGCDINIPDYEGLIHAYLYIRSKQRRDVEEKLKYEYEEYMESCEQEYFGCKDHPERCIKFDEWKKWDDQTKNPYMIQPIRKDLVCSAYCKRELEYKMMEDYNNKKNVKDGIIIDMNLFEIKINYNNEFVDEIDYNIDDDEEDYDSSYQFKCIDKYFIKEMLDITHISNRYYHPITIKEIKETIRSILKWNTPEHIKHKEAKKLLSRLKGEAIQICV